MPQINPFESQTMRSTTATSSYGDQKWDLGTMFPREDGIVQSELNEFQRKGYNAASDNNQGGAV